MHRRRARLPQLLRLERHRVQTRARRPHVRAAKRERRIAEQVNTSERLRQERIEQHRRELFK